jgi:formylglycine-generating enzyme required for sulfatase activity
LRLGVIVLVLAGLGAGTWYWMRRQRLAEARERPMAQLPGRSVKIGNDWRARDHAPLALEERPAHFVEVAAFAIDLHEVTVAAYRVCVETGACAPPAKGPECNWGRDGLDTHPINCVSFDQAEQLCAWAGKRLPTEVEWEYAAGGAEPKRIFPWGDAFSDGTHANLCGLECARSTQGMRAIDQGEICGPDGCRKSILDVSDSAPATAPVASFPAGNTPEGLADMGGNVWEWTASVPCTYPDHACADDGRRVIRGGGWTHRYLLSPEVTTRDQLPRSAVSEGVGFRCAR